MNKKMLAISLAGALTFGCATTDPYEENGQASLTENLVPSADEDRVLMDAFMAASRGIAAGNPAAEAKKYAVVKGETDALKLVLAAITEADRQVGWHRCLELKTQQAMGQVSTFSSWPTICRAILLAEQRMFDQAKRLLAPTSLRLAAVEYAYILGHLKKQRFDQVRRHLAAARAIMPDHPLLDLVAARVAPDPKIELVLLEKVYAQDQGHIWVLTELAKAYDKTGDPRATDLLMRAANINPTNTKMRMQLAGRFAKDGKMEAAERQYRAVIEVLPDDRDALRFLRQRARSRGDQVDELNWVRRALAAKAERDPDELRLTEALLLVGLGQREEALKAFKSLLEENEYHETANLFLAAVYNKEGKPFLAINHLLRAGEKGREAMAVMAKKYEVGSAAPKGSRKVAPIFWAIEPQLKKRFKSARQRSPLAKSGRVKWRLSFDDKGRTEEIERTSKRVDDPWFLAGAELLLYTIEHSKMAGGSMEYELLVP
jgi:tetratricopeptide (TPR) repeat protein